MPNTGDRKEIKRYADARETQTVQEAKQMVSQTKQRTAQLSEEELAREHRHAVPGKATPPKRPLTEEQASEQMLDEGDPNTVPKK